MFMLSYFNFKNFDNKRIVGIFIVLVLSIVIILAALSLLGLVVEVGNHTIPYPGQDLVGDYLLGIFWAIVLGGSILFWPISSQNKKALLWIWLIKTIVVLIVMLAYEYHYGFDIDGYYANAITPDFAWDGFKFGNGTRIIAQLVWLHNKIMFNSYYAVKIGFALIGLFASYLFYRAVTVYLRRQDIHILYVLALFPSVLFWSSILGKDPITFFGVSLYVYGIVAWYRFRQLRYLVVFLIGIIIIALIRIWLVPIVIIPLLILFIVARRSFIQQILFLSICILTFTVVLPKIQYMWSISTFEDLFKFRSYATTAFVGGGSSFSPPEITGFLDLIKFLPGGIFTALFRPLPWEVPNLFGFIQGLENVVLLFLLILAVKRTRLNELRDPIIFWALLLIIIWASFYGIVTYNFGALVRYKLQILPILVSLLLYLSRNRIKTSL